MTTVLLSLLAAASCNLGDFNGGGLFSRRGGAWAVSLCRPAQSTTWCSSSSRSLASPPQPTSAGRSPVASPTLRHRLPLPRPGVGTDGRGRTGLRGRRRGGAGPGRHLAGERPGAGLARRPAGPLPAIWLVSREPVTGPTVGVGSGLLDGVLAGLGFAGTLLRRSCRSPARAGWFSLALNQLVAGFRDHRHRDRAAGLPGPDEPPRLRGPPAARSARWRPGCSRSPPGWLPRRRRRDHPRSPRRHGAAPAATVLREHVHRAPGRRLALRRVHRARRGRVSHPVLHPAGGQPVGPGEPAAPRAGR